MYLQYRTIKVDALCRSFCTSRVITRGEGWLCYPTIEVDSMSQTINLMGAAEDALLRYQIANDEEWKSIRKERLQIPREAQSAKDLKSRCVCVLAASIIRLP